MEGRLPALGGSCSLQERHTPGLPNVSHQITAEMPLASQVGRLGRVIGRLRVLESPLRLLISPLGRPVSPLGQLTRPMKLYWMIDLKV